MEMNDKLVKLVCYKTIHLLDKHCIEVLASFPGHGQGIDHEL